MKKLIFIIIGLTLGLGCAEQPSSNTSPETSTESKQYVQDEAESRVQSLEFVPIDKTIINNGGEEWLQNHIMVGQIRAIDPEGDPLTYSIIKQTIPDMFFIDPMTGVFYFHKKDWDRALEKRNFVIHVKVTDGRMVSVNTYKVLVEKDRTITEG